MFGNLRMTRSRTPRSRANAPASSRSISRLKPTTSAMRIAASLRVTALRFKLVPVPIKIGEANRNITPGWAANRCAFPIQRVESGAAAVDRPLPASGRYGGRGAMTDCGRLRKLAKAASRSA